MRTRFKGCAPTGPPKTFFSRKGAKAQRKPLETRQRFAALRESSSPKEVWPRTVR